MTVYGEDINRISSPIWNSIVIYMDDEKREEVHREKAPCSREEFLKAYLEKDPAFVVTLEQEFDWKE